MDGHAHIYITEWSDGRVKVGMAMVPNYRLAEHCRKQSPAWIRRWRVFDRVERRRCMDVELELKKRLAAIHQPDEGCAEWFTGLPFETAEACATEILAA